jgi:hypothetical protein
MRKFLIPLLLASAAATPAVAGPRHNSDNQQVREDRQQVREERQQVHEDRQEARSDARAERQEVRVERSAPQAGQFSGFARPDRADTRPERIERSDPGSRFGGFTRPDRSDVRPDRGGEVGGRFQPGADNYRAPGPRTVTPDFNGSMRDRMQDRADRRQDRIDSRDLRQSDRSGPRIIRNREPVISDVPRPGTQPPPRLENRRTPQVQWSTSWRNNSRYDWRNYRHHHRSRFHLGFYYDPYGWGYEPFSIGWRLWPSYYSRNYWINDPWMYRLPYAPPGYVWIRYFNDALLVDMWSGQVVDAIPDFFW